jgi:signal transduction histidine kinase
MPRTANRSISVPIILSSIAVLLTVLMLVGWVLVMRENQSLTRALWSNGWLLAGGILSLAAVMSVLVLFSVSLVGQILEGRRQQMFIDSVTHELKSPLASIKLCLETMAREGLSAPQRGNLRQMMLADVERLNVFIDDILEASRISHGRRTQTWVIVDVTRLVRAAMDSIRQRYDLDAAAFVLEAPDMVELTTDPTALEIIIKNILDNAVKYSASPPQVEIRMQILESGHLGIRVRDQGIGIERAQLKRVFKRFHRVSSPQVNERSGTGLGLYVVSQLVRNLGGRIRAESAGAGLGTTMSIRLPISIVKERPVKS